MDASDAVVSEEGLQPFLNQRKEERKKSVCVVNGASVGEEELVPL